MAPHRYIPDPNERRPADDDENGEGDDQFLEPGNPDLFDDPDDDEIDDDEYLPDFED